MDRNVILTVSGLHMGMGTENDPISGKTGVAGIETENNIETVAQAEYFKKNDSHYLLYEEWMEGFSRPSRTRIKFKNNSMELTRRGLLNTHMIFEENKKHKAHYNMPYGELVLEIDTKRVTLEETENFIRVLVEYTLDMDGGYLEEDKIELLIREQKNK